MSCDLFLRGELRIKPGHEGAVEALADLIDAEAADAVTLAGNVVEINIDENVNVSHYTWVWDGLVAFVDEHCEHAAAIQTAEDPATFALFGSDERQREEAYRQYCDKQIENWTALREQAAKEAML